jgi:hypothetical protein
MRTVNVMDVSEKNLLATPAMVQLVWCSRSKESACPALQSWLLVAMECLCWAKVVDSKALTLDGKTNGC